MIDILLGLSERDLLETANALRSGRLVPPYSTVALQRVVSKGAAESTARALDRLSEQGFTPTNIATTLEILRADRVNRPAFDDVLELVTTGPEIEGIANRDTSVVVRDLFANATQTVLLAGFAVYQGHKVFQALADRMLAVPNLKVRLFLDIQRQHGDTSAASEIVRRFAAQFRIAQWPNQRPLPQVFFDPRSLDASSQKRSCLHAKAVVVDSRSVFISSANFTEAAQQRNIEVGILANSESLAHRLTAFFDKGLSGGVFHLALDSGPTCAEMAASTNS
jgi:phosphatidylserine/phosphatidylglycerophosphate/cardiolipin synthase-like enzyme